MRLLFWPIVALELLIPVYCIVQMKQFADPEAFGRGKTRVLAALCAFALMWGSVSLLPTVLMPAVFFLLPALLISLITVTHPTFLRRERHIRGYLVLCLAGSAAWIIISSS